MNDDYFYAPTIVVATAVVLVTIVFASCTVGVNTADNNAMVEMVNKGGADPIEARCAVKDATNSTCILVAAKRGVGVKN